MAKLIVTTSPAGPANHDVGEDLVTVGRAPENTIVLDDNSVSSRHAEIRAVGQGYLLRDLGSTNGTRVNGNGAREIILRPGDHIRFGGVEARFEDSEVKSTQPLPVAEKVHVVTAETSERPADFANASPFRTRRDQGDRSRTLLFVTAGVAALLLLAAMIAVFTMHATAL